MSFCSKIKKNIPGNFEKEKLFSLIVTLAIMAVLVLSGPASAFNLKLSGFSIAEPEKGQEISTTAEIEINSGEIMTLVNPIQLLVDNEVVCSFNVNGNNVNCNEGISVSLVSNTSGFGYGYGYEYGYGYGYGYNQGYSTGKFTYNITLDTSNFTIGNHRIQLKINPGNNNIYSSDEVEITIKPQGAETTETENNVAPGTEKSFDGNNVKIILNGTESARITVSEFSSRPNNTNTFSIPGLNRYYQIEANTSNIGETLIKVYYTDSEVNAVGLDENALKLYFYNSISGTWELPLESGVDTVNNFVWAKTNHFSIWGVFGNAVSIVSTTTTNSNGGGCSTSWTCSDWSACANGEQTRTCNQLIENCYAGKMPIQSRTCTENQNQPNLPEEPEEELILKEPTSTQEGFFSGITGAAIGTLGAGGIIVAVLFIIGISALSITVFMVRRKRRINIAKIKSN